MEHKPESHGSHGKSHASHGKKSSSDHVTISKSSIVTVLLAAVVIISLVNVYSTWTLHSKFDELTVAPTGAAVAAPTPTPTPTPAPIADVGADDDAVLGDPDAPIEIIEFSDFECPFCARFYNDAYQQLKTQYVDTGKAKIVYRDFPLSFHPNAQKAAEAAECAGEQGKYYDMHDLLFENGVAGGVAQYKGFADQLGLDRDAFDSCLDNGDMAAEVQADMAAGSAAGASGTPSFFINGVKLVGAQPFSAFQQIIEQQLAAQ